MNKKEEKKKRRETSKSSFKVKTNKSLDSVYCMSKRYFKLAMINHPYTKTSPICYIL